jgi:hypothetical protein
MLKLAAIFTLVATPAWAQQDPELEAVDRTEDRLEETIEDIAPIELRWEPDLRAEVRAGAGAMRGDTINPGRGAVSLVDGKVHAGIARGRLSLDLPIDFAHRQTFAGASLTESRVRGDLRGTFRLSPRLRLTGALGLAATRKPDWPDPFQELGPTDRYSHWDRNALVEIIARPVRHQRVRVRYDYALAVYRQDPMFDPIYDPLHLTPWDRDTHRVDAVWRLRQGRWKLRAGAELAQRQYFFTFSGDAKTGVTHVGAGGEPPNPLLQQRWVKPRVELDVELAEAILLTARYELELVQDTHDGYLSYAGHHPEIAVSWALPHESELIARAEAYLRRYGRHSYDYQLDDTHPPLAWGDRRADRIGIGELVYRLPVAPHWTAIADARLALRRTNYEYSIDWNYTNWIAWAGAEYRY